MFLLKKYFKSVKQVGIVLDNTMTQMSPVKSVLIDLSGTIHIENDITPGAVEALNKLRETDLNIKFVTNTTKESRRFLHKRLQNLGFQVKEEEIYTSLWAARDLIKRENLKPLLFLDDDASEDFSDVGSSFEKPDSVVVGLAPKHFNRSKLNDGFRILLNGGRLIAVHEAKYYKRKDGLALGPGPFVKCLEYASGVKAVVVGKPSEEFFRGALDGVSSESAVMIGDDVQSDIEGAQKIGIRGYLVKTGKYRAYDETKIEPSPFKTVDNFALAVEDILNSRC